ncbi:hypothetical protein DV451_001918 [Geotrichum candidum]|uniref:Uncharacterized protein n=1 Tax=Geotrichum candidum TaxID=1173061 RepID=A0A9P5KUZ9_GEOCN|nr:hypothetical protein DV451_001918 [Geotrichum candidum]KAF5111175.1 hypothetical protein DV453_000416 [Geotrichum candidum]
MEHELEEIKAEQGLLAKQYTAVAKSLISSKSHRLSIMIQALKKGEKLSVFESIYRSQTTAHEKRLRRASKQRDYEKYSVHKVAIGEVDNVWLQFYENKQKLRERMIHDINERICDIQREFYMKAERDNRASDPKTLVQNMRRVAANLGPTPALSGLQPDEIEADLARLRRSRHFHHRFLINSNHSSTNCNSINSTCSSSNNTNCNSNNNINTNYINNINWSSNNIINTNWSSSRDLLFPRCLKP